MDPFSSRKAAVLAELASAERDKSKKGGLDAPIKDLVDRINGHDSFFTTSSCSGRISLFLEPIAAQRGATKKKVRSTRPRIWTRIPSHVSEFAIQCCQSQVSRSIEPAQYLCHVPFLPSPFSITAMLTFCRILPEFMPLCREANGSSSVTSGPIQGRSYLPFKASIVQKGGY